MGSVNCANMKKVCKYVPNECAGAECLCLSFPAGGRNKSFNFLLFTAQFCHFKLNIQMMLIG